MLHYRATTMLVSAAVLAVTVYLFVIMPKGFLPDEDTGQIFVFTEGAQGISFDSMVKHQLALTQLVMKQDMWSIPSCRSPRAATPGGCSFA